MYVAHTIETRLDPHIGTLVEQLYPAVTIQLQEGPGPTLTVRPRAGTWKLTGTRDSSVEVAHAADALPSEVEQIIAKTIVDHIKARTRDTYPAQEIVGEPSEDWVLTYQDGSKEHYIEKHTVGLTSVAKLTTISGDDAIALRWVITLSLPTPQTAWREISR